ncbi:hypothetical protein MK079_04050 [Candidatus Gracilibacteria bacterium]|nr:hypothetical protein [Candidatus Gracilibacteria bacterium]
MKKSISILVVLIGVFIVHIALYYSISDYRFFWEKIKNPEEIIYIDESDIEISDAPIPDQASTISTLDPVESLLQDLDVSEELRSNDKTESVKEVVLGEKYRNILNLFRRYSLEPIESQPILFDITDEYPDPYYEYYHPNVVLYLFPTKRYDDILDIFSVLSPESPFVLNPINNFGDQSFYINLNEGVADDWVRVLIEKDGITFGLKIKKTEYNRVKEILLTLPNI